MDVEGLEEQFRQARQHLAEEELDSKLRQAQDRLRAVGEHNAWLRQIQQDLNGLPPPAQRHRQHAPRPGNGTAGEGERVLLLLDRDNRGQKFLDGLGILPPSWTVHVIYNPNSKHAFPPNPAGDIRFHPSLTNDKECNAAVLAFVAGQVAAEEDAASTFVYLVFCDEHSRHEEVIENLRADDFHVETCSSYQYTIADVLEWHKLDPEEYMGSVSAQVDIRYQAAGPAASWGSLSSQPASPAVLGGAAHEEAGMASWYTDLDTSRPPPPPRRFGQLRR